MTVGRWKRAGAHTVQIDVILQMEHQLLLRGAEAHPLWCCSGLSAYMQQGGTSDQHCLRLSDAARAGNSCNRASALAQCYRLYLVQLGLYPKPDAFPKLHAIVLAVSSV